MARSTPNRYPVVLTAEQRGRLEALTRAGSAPVSRVRHARALLLSDGGRPGGRLTRARIADALGMHVNTVDRLRKRFVLEGEEPALNRKARAEPPTPPKIDGRVEAHLVAICCGPTPAGRARWTLSLLAGELTRRGLVTSVSVETVRQALKKTGCSPGGGSAGASPSGTRPGSSPRWRTSSTCTPPATRPRRP
jgi:transposase